MLGLEAIAALTVKFGAVSQFRPVARHANCSLFFEVLLVQSPRNRGSGAGRHWGARTPIHRFQLAAQGRGQGGRRVACKWRIRHKLMLGIGLVVGIMAFLLVGTLQGLFAYRDTMRSIDSKLEELIAANDIRASLEG